MMTPRSQRLTLAALATASSLIALASPAVAQSVCVNAAGTVTCAPGSTTVTVDTTVGTTIGGQVEGLGIAAAGHQTVTGSGTITTSNANNAVQITSGGDLVVAGDESGVLNAAATGTGSGFVLGSAGSLDATLGSSTVADGIALAANTGGDATISTGALGSTGLGGALVVSTNGDAALTVDGPVTVSGADAVGVGVLAQNGSASLAVTGEIVNTSIGAYAIGAGAAASGDVTVDVGNVSVAGGAGIGAAVGGLSNIGNTSVSCGNVTSTGAGVAGVVAVGADVVVRCGNITTTGINSDGLDAIATNSIDSIVGNISTSGSNSWGMFLTAPGAITATSGAIATSGDTSRGVGVIGLDGPIDITTGNVTTTGLAADGINIVSTTGSVTLDAGQVSATGVGSTGVSVTTIEGNQDLRIAGVSANLDGIDATALGGASIAVTATGPVTSATGFGILTVGTTGATTITEAGASGVLGGVFATNAATGNVTVNATGGTTTATAGDAIGIATAGIATTNVAAGATVRGQSEFDAIGTAGQTANAITNRGTIGLASNGIGAAIRATSGVTTINNLAGGSLTGPILLGLNGDVVNNSGALTLTGASDFGLGSDTLNNLPGGVLALNQSAVVTGLETLNNGGTANVAGTTVLTGTAFNNLASGTVSATGGAAALAGITAFNNAGLVTLADGAANDTLTLSGNYAGSGGARLAIDAAPGLGSADRLVIGGNATGTTRVDVNFLSGDPLYDPAGVLIVDAGGTASSGAFVLNPANVAQGFLNYGIRQSGNDFFLASTLDASVTDLALISSAAPEMWYQSFDAYHDAIMGRQGGGREGKLGIWANLYLSRDKYGDSAVTASPFGQQVTYSERLENKRRGAQGGLEYRGGAFTIGVTGGYEHNSPTFTNTTALDLEGYNYGAYALFGMENGIYGGVMYKRDEYDVDFFNGARGVYFRTDGHSEGVDGELGLRFGSGVKFDVNAGASWVKTHVDPYQNYGLTFAYNDLESVRGRAGARVIFEDWGGVFVGAKAFHEFRDDARLDVNGAALVGSVDAARRGTWARVEAGVGAGNQDAAQLTLWADLGDTKGIGGRIGFHF